MALLPYGSAPTRIGGGIVGSTANRFLTTDSSGNLDDTFLGVSDTEPLPGLYSKVFTNPHASWSNASLGIGFLDLSDYGGTEHVLISVGSTSGDGLLISNGAITIGTWTTDGLSLATGARITEFSTDGTLAGNSDTAVPTEQAVKTYADSVAGLQNIVEDLTPQLGGNLDGNGKNISWAEASSAQVLLPVGSADYPSLGFNTAVNPGRAGFYLEASSLAMGRLGTVFSRFGPSVIAHGVDIYSYASSRGFQINVGTAIGAPSFAFRADTTTGWGRGAANLTGYLSAYISGTEVLAFNPDGTMATRKGRVKHVTRVTTTYTILVTDEVIFANTDSAGYTVTLPAGAAGQTFTIKNTGSSGNTLTVAPNGSEHLLGVNSNFTLNDSEDLEITYNATDGWY